ncbi:hypothetical protein CK203_089040 [Vitis vinifera]|uniref:DUF4283 domain-containing protein n=1 Tax=Vitis vinifera TaxID=29760 RepID=A0A438F5M2_VITVI|nr:hypothetical protein CK203_089040 [Vitis vinifera]
MLVTTGGGSDDGCSIGEAEGEAELDPIRVILENGRGMEGSCSFGRELGVIKEVIGALLEKDLWGGLLEEAGVAPLCWSSNCLESAQSRSGEILRVGCCERATGGIVVFWDNKVLQLVGMEVGKFSLFWDFNMISYLGEHSRGRLNSTMRSFSKGWRPRLNGLLFENLEARDTLRLEEPFSKEEVFSVMSGFNGDKAPGSDKFSMAFWLFSWDFVKNEGGVKNLRNFRPISLVGGLYKWIENNFNKGKLIPMERVKNIDDLAYEFGCKVSWVPPSFVKETTTRLAWFFCGQKGQEGLEGSSLTHLLDGVEGKE